MLKKRNRFFIIGLLLIMATTFFGVSNNVNADDDGVLGFSVQSVFNSNQLETSSNIFYLKAEPGGTQDVSVKIRNDSEDKMKIKLTVLDAFTSEQATISYISPEKVPNKDETLKEPISELVSFENDTVEINSGEEKVVKITVDSPKENYEGIKLGALGFYPDSDEEEEGLGIEAGYDIGIILAQNGEQFNIGDQLLLNDVKASLVRGKKMVIANMQNPTPYTVENLDIKTTIIDKKNNKVIKEREVKGASLAPNSNFDFEMDWGLAQLPVGTFQYKALIKNDFYEWPFEKEFTISGALAKEINDESGIKIKTPNWIKILAIGQVALLLLLSILIVVRRKKMKRQFTEKNKSKRRNKKRRK